MHLHGAWKLQENPSFLAVAFTGTATHFVSAVLVPSPLAIQSFVVFKFFLILLHVVAVAPAILRHGTTWVIADCATRRFVRSRRNQIDQPFESDMIGVPMQTICEMTIPARKT
jgi:hypothetical protein